ncbi:YpiF family protein [Alteribacillus iranensis]|uniref:Uncharacterized protein n=1 Tax=Alteribacillus iranensis TaxID=930128 RepID=A0A1I1ZRJ3_9BACI|nr:YpiF family protein [Alteribacillus iranensis]SFE34202.1 Protein of unknown function [Alteribacillus iranensis]
MKWTTEDIPSFVAEKQYIDTALVPLLPINFDNSIKQSAAMAEFITVMAAEIERQFHGRMLLTPPFTYLSEEGVQASKERLEHWQQQMKGAEIKHIIFLTADSEWKKVENELDEMLIWMPLVPFENMDSEYKKQIISEQIKQLLPLVVNKWKENP